MPVQPNPYKLPVSAPQTDVYGNVTHYIPGFNALTQQWDYNPNTGQAYAPGQTTEGVGSHYEGQNLISSTGQKLGTAPAVAAQPTQTNIQQNALGQWQPIPGSNLAKTALPMPPKPVSTAPIAPAPKPATPAPVSGFPNPDEYMKPSSTPAAPGYQPAPPAATITPSGAPLNLPPGFNVGLGSQDPAINRQVYGADYFPGATSGPGQKNAGFGYFLLNNGWQRGKGAPTTPQEFAALSPADQQLYRTILAKYHQAGGQYTPTAQDLGQTSGPAAPAPPSAPAPPAAPAPPTVPQPVVPPGGSPGGQNALLGQYGTINNSYANGSVIDPRLYTQPPQYSAGDQFESGLPPLQVRSSLQDVVTSPEYQVEQADLNKQLNRQLLAQGRQNSTYGTNAIADANTRLAAQEYQRISDENYNRNLQLNSLLYNRRTDLENQQYQRGFTKEEQQYQRGFTKEEQQYNRAFTQEQQQYGRAFTQEQQQYDRAFTKEEQQYNRSLGVDERDYGRALNMAQLSLQAIGMSSSSGVADQLAKIILADSIRQGDIGITAGNVNANLASSLGNLPASYQTAANQQQQYGGGYVNPATTFGGQPPFSALTPSYDPNNPGVAYDPNFGVPNMGSMWSSVQSDFLT